MNFYISDITTIHPSSRCSRFIIDILFINDELKTNFSFELLCFYSKVRKTFKLLLINALYWEEERTGKVNIPMYRTVEDKELWDYV